MAGEQIGKHILAYTLFPQSDSFSPSKALGYYKKPPPPHHLPPPPPPPPPENSSNTPESNDISRFITITSPLTWRENEFTLQVHFNNLTPLRGVFLSLRSLSVSRHT